MKLFTRDRTELIDISALDRDGNVLVIKGRIYGTMPMTACLSPKEARRAFRLLSWRLALFLATFLFRRSG
ncbi:MAG: hypothetical protein FWD12_13520 [Alphaproteobacteria bacterium]|nr:hypothetical protein [Alphaproteobacteria bacterium]